MGGKRTEYQREKCAWATWTKEELKMNPDVACFSRLQVGPLPQKTISAHLSECNALVVGRKWLNDLDDLLDRG